MTPTWVILPVLNGLPLALDALQDALRQSVPTRVLVINQGLPDADRAVLEARSAEDPDRIFVWSHQPPLPSLSATWNRALRFAWQTGTDQALVINHDVRLHPRTIEGLQGALHVSHNLLVSAVGVTPAQFHPEEPGPLYWYDEAKRDVIARGGPDFSCFLISQACHWKYPFDEAFTPAFCEDLDLHRRILLAGEGDRIFSVNLPYLHYSSQTIKALDETARAALDRRINAGSRAHYARKWGGPVNQERFTIPFDAETDQDGVTTPELQARPPVPPEPVETEDAPDQD